MNSIMQKPSGFNLYQYLDKSKKKDFLKHVRYKLIKKNYLQSLKENSDYIFEIVEGAVKVGLYSRRRNEIISEILVPGAFYGSYIFKNMAHLDLVKPLTHVKVRVYDLSFVRNRILTDSDVAKFFYQISLSAHKTGEHSCVS